MTTPDRPLRMELTFEMPGTPEQVWDAIATQHGMSAWFLPTDVEERVGGRVVFHMGETSSEGIITAFDAPHRIVYEEPDWAGLSGHEGADVTPLVTEFVVEARSGGSCVVRVVSSAFGTGADWEREFFEEMEKGWTPWFEHLRLYLQHFPGQHATRLDHEAQLPGTAEAVVAAIRQSFGITGEGQQIDAHGLGARVETIADDRLLLRLEAPIPGYMSFFALDMGDGRAYVTLAGYLYSENAQAYVDAQQANWSAWLDGLVVTAS